MEKNFRVKPGMFCYEDRTFSEELVTGKTVSGIVGYVEAHRALVVCLHEKKLPWSSSGLMVFDIRLVRNGKAATEKILKAMQNSDSLSEAALWCVEYHQDGVNKGEAFLPFDDELQKLSEHYFTINRALKCLKMPEMDGWHWSSRECNFGEVWKVRMYNGHAWYEDKTALRHVRPVFWVAF